MTVQEWKQRYIAELVRLGWPQDDAEDDFKSGYCGNDGKIDPELIDPDSSPESAAQDENSYALDG